MGEGWPLVPLGAVLVQDRSYIDAPELREYPKLSVKLYGRGAVLDGPANGAELKMQRHQLARAGQVILSEIWGKKGAVGLVPPEGDGALCTSHFFLFDLVPSRVEPGYLRLLFRANYLEPQLGGEARGTTGYAAVRPKHLLSATIPLPPLQEQWRIVARVEAIAAKVEEAQRLRHGAAEGISALRKSSAHALLTRFSGRKLPLADLVSVRGGGTPSKGNPFYWEGSIPWISPKDMKSRELADAQDHISEQAVRETAARLIDPGAVLIVVRGMILAHTVPAAMLRVAAAVNQDMKALVPDDGLLPEYLCAALWAMNQDLLRLVEKSTHDTRKLETEKLMGFEIPVPAVAEQRAFLGALGSVEALLAQVQAQQNRTEAELAAILPSLLARAFRGEL